MPQYADILGSIGQGQQFVDGLFTQRANREAGAALAAGDYGSAAGTMFRSGNLSGGQGIRDQQQANQTRQAEQDAATRARRLETTQQIVRATRAVRDSGGNVAAEISRIEPAILAMGTDLNEWNQIKTSVLSNPAVLDDIENIVGQQLRELEIVNYGSGRGGVAIDKATGQVVNEFGPKPEPIINNNVIRDPVTFDVIADDRDPEYIQRDPTKDLLDVSPAAGGTRGGSSSRTTPDAILQGILEREGGFVASDGRSGAPANFGINQRANPDIDVANLTRPQAEQIYRDRYINPILQAGVQGPILDAVVDFGVNAGVNRSLDFWRRSNGDIDEFNRLRLAHYRSLPDYQQNGRSWERRVQETTPGSSGSVSAGGGPRVVSQARPEANGAGILSAEEQAALGLPAGGRYQRNSNGTYDLIEGTASGGRNGQFDATTRGALDTARNAAAAARSRAADAQRFVQLNQQRGTGPGARLAGPALALDPTYAEMRAIGSRLVPGERQAGSGAMSDRDVNLYREAVIGLQNPGPTNQALSRVISAQADRDAQYSAFLDEYATRNGNLNGANEDWSAYVNANPLFEARGGNTQVRPTVQPWRQFMGYGERQSAASQQSQTPAPQTPRLRFQPSEAQIATARRIDTTSASRGGSPLGSQAYPRYLNPTNPRGSYNNIPVGEYYIDPQGNIRQRR